MTPQAASPTDQVFKYLSLWGHISSKPSALQVFCRHYQSPKVDGPEGQANGAQCCGALFALSQRRKAELSITFSTWWAQASCHHPKATSRKQQ